MKKLLRNVFILLSLVLFIFPSAALADLIPDGQKTIDYRFQISNIEDYSDYVFIVYFQEPMGGYEILDKDAEISFYKFSNPKVYAIKKVNFNEADIGEERKEEKEYFTLNKDLLSSDMEIKSISAVSENDSRDKIVDVFKIDELSEDNLVLKKSKVIYTYLDGSTEEKDYINQDIRPRASKQSILSWWFIKFWYFVLPLLAIIIFVSILFVRKLRK